MRWLLFLAVFFGLVTLHTGSSASPNPCPSELPGDVACVGFNFSGSTSPPPCGFETCALKGTTYFAGYLFQNAPFVSQFANPLPADSAVLSLGIQAYGRFQCATEPTTIFVTVNDNLVAYGSPGSQSTDGCDCPNCAQLLNFTAANATVTLSDSNVLTITPIDSMYISLSQVSLYFVYAPLVPDVDLVSPTALPVLGGQLSLLSADAGFVQSPDIVCAVRSNSSLLRLDYYTPGVYVNSSFIVCQAPPVPIPGLALLSASYDNATFSQPAAFYYGALPQVKMLFPSSSQSTDLQPVTIVGSNFLVDGLQTIGVRFGSGQGSVYSANETTIVVLPPELSAVSNASSQRVAAELLITQNGGAYWYDTGTFFTYVVAGGGGAGEQEPFLPVWAWILIGTAVVCFVSSVLFFALTLRQLSVSSRQRRAAPDSEAAPLLSEARGVSRFPRHLRPSFNNVELAAIKDLQLIDRGSFGLIYRGRWEGTVVAVKKLPSAKLTPEFIEELGREAEIMKSLRHPNLLNFIGTSCDPAGRQICIVMEYMDRGSLYRLIHDSAAPLSLEQMKHVGMDTARGMNYLHGLSPQIVHRDLKSHNLLLNSSGVTKVCDFGLSRFIESTLAGTMTACGTPSWTAPEVLRNEPYNYKVDVYSFGVVLWEMFARTDPYPGMPPFQIVFAVGNQNARPKIDPQWPAAWCRLMQDCWAEDQEQRPTFEQILARFQDLN